VDCSLLLLSRELPLKVPSVPDILMILIFEIGRNADDHSKFN
jgi:hypothetical protein